MPKLSKVALLVVVMLVVSAGSLAQTPPPAPGPEHQKLAGLVGNWTSEGEVTENPFGQAEKWSAKISSEWFPGKFAVVRHEQGRGSVSGNIPGLSIIAYDSAAHTYTWYGIDGTGWTGLGRGSISDNVLIVVWELQVKGKTYKNRGTLSGLGSDKLTFIGEYSEDGQTWKAYFHSTDTKVKQSK